MFFFFFFFKKHFEDGVNHRKEGMGADAERTVRKVFEPLKNQHLDQYAVTERGKSEC